MARRSAMRKTGYNVNTMQEIMFRKGGLNLSQSGRGTGTKYFDFVTADYIADTMVGDAQFRIDVNHFLGDTAYSWHLINADNGGAVLTVDWKQGADKLELWFYDNSKNIRVIISP